MFAIIAGTTYNIAIPCYQSLPGQLITWPPRVDNRSRSRCPSYENRADYNHGMTKIASWVVQDWNNEIDHDLGACLAFHRIELIVCIEPSSVTFRSVQTFHKLKFCKEHTSIIFQAAWHFASASCLKSDDFYIGIDWSLKFSGICISNRKPKNTLTNRIHCAFNILQYTWTVVQRQNKHAMINFPILYQNSVYLNYACSNITLSNRFFLHFLFTTKPCSANTHWIRSVIVLFDVNLIGIDDQFIICIMMVSWNFLLLAEMKCHAIWKMTESASLTIYSRYLRIVLFIFYLFLLATAVG